MKQFILFKYLLISILLITYSCSDKEKEEQQLAAGRMKEFVINLSQYAKQQNPNFIIIPQNGEELCFINQNLYNGLEFSYIQAIDGVGVEALYYNGTYELDSNRLWMLQQIKQQNKQVLVSEFVTNTNNIADAYQIVANQGFVCFVRSPYNYYYTQIPDTIPFENTDNIINLNQVKNFIYLINSSSFASKQDFIQALAATNFDLILIDLFFNNEPFSLNEIQQLKTKANGAQRLVVAYMNIGAAENYRYYWQSSWNLHHPSWIRKKYPGYDDEYYVAYWEPEWQQIIYGNDQSYLKKILDAGFDGAYLDNVQAYYYLFNN
jgi:cysteinyl-tRNA synthetase